MQTINKFKILAAGKFLKGDELGEYLKKARESGLQVLLQVGDKHYGPGEVEYKIPKSEPHTHYVKAVITNNLTIKSEVFYDPGEGLYRTF